MYDVIVRCFGLFLNAGDNRQVRLQSREYYYGVFSFSFIGFGNAIEYNRKLCQGAFSQGVKNLALCRRVGLGFRK